MSDDAAERAKALVEVVDRGNGYQSMRLRGQSGLLWHTADADLMARRVAETEAVIAEAIRAAVADAENRAAIPEPPRIVFDPPG